MTEMPKGEARLALAEALADYPGFTLPDPLRECDDCHEHAAFYGPDEDDRYFCGSCAPRHSVFIIRTPPTDPRQVAADAALAEARA